MSPQGLVHHRWLLAALALAIAGQGVGCDKPRSRFDRIEPVLPTLEPAPVNTPYASRERETMGEWLQVTTDLGQMQAAELAARQQAETDFQNLKKRFEEGPPFYLEKAERNLILRHGAALRTHLRGVAQGSITRKGPALATASLVYLGELEFRPALVRALERGNKPTRLALLEALTFGRWVENPETVKFRQALADPAVAARLCTQMEDADPEIVVAALDACTALETPGASERFLRAILKLPREEQASVQHCLTQAPVTPDLLRFAVRLSPQQAESDDYWSPDLLTMIVRKGTGDVQTRAKAEARRLVELAGDTPDKRLPARFALLQALGETATAEDLPWLERRLAESPAEAIVAVVRLRGDAGRKKLLEMLQAGENSGGAVEAAGVIFRGTNDTDAMAALVKVANTNHGRLWSVCEAMHQIGGPAALDKHRRMVRRLDPTEAAHFLQLAQPVDFAAMGARAVELGLLTNDERRDALEALKAQDGKEETSDGILRLLHAAGRVLHVGAEAAEMPCRHDRLLREFADCSQRKFQPTALSEIQDRLNPDEEPGDYLVRLVSGPYLYQARIRNHGDWYDLERIRLLVNRVLSDTGAQERFVSLRAHGEVVTYVFGDPQKIAAAAPELFLELSEE